MTKELKNLAESLQAMAMEELNQLAEDLKEQVGDAASDLMEGVEEVGTGGMLDEMGGMMADAVAEKRSRMETWRVREVAAVCFRMLAVAPQIQVSCHALQGLVDMRTLSTFNQ